MPPLSSSWAGDKSAVEGMKGAATLLGETGRERAAARGRGMGTSQG